MTTTDEREITRLQGILATDGKGCGNDSSDDYDCWENGKRALTQLGERGCEDGDVDPCWQGNEDPRAQAGACNENEDDGNYCGEHGTPAVSAQACQGNIDGDDWCGEGGGPQARGGDDDADYVCWAQKDSKRHAAATAAV